MTTTERPMTDAERRALDALVEWREAGEAYQATEILSREARVQNRRFIRAQSAMKRAADALRKERGSR
jgi:hypothetical protein